MAHKVGTADEYDPEFQEFIKKYVKIQQCAPYNSGYILVEKKHKNDANSSNS